MTVNKLSERVLSIMKQKSVSKADMAEALEIDIFVIEGWENGLSRPHLTQIPIIAQVLDVPIEDIVIYSGEKKAVELLTKYGSLHNLINSNQAMAELENVLPFLDTQLINDLYLLITEKGSTAHNFIVKLISHMNQNEIDRIADNAIENNIEFFNKILPFVSENVIMKQISNCDLYDFNNIQRYLPYINEKKVEQIAAKYIIKYGITEITRFAPYISNEFYNLINK